ncbi:MAG: ABC transporter ATP-binding protein [Gammaproteobacteria bacterium]|jgi:putative ABC transport system ATP-binding protein
MLSIANLRKSYRYEDVTQQVLDGLDFEMETASSLALLGESGSGKSTLLHLIAGLDRPDSGEILFAGQRVDTLSESALAALRRSELSLVFQQFHLIATLNVIDNLRFQAALCRRFDADYEAELVSRLGLGEHLSKYPQQLSRGQQQRVAIARALLHKPALVLADEPTGNLDEASSLEVMGLFSDLVKQAGSGLLMVTHSRAMAEFMDRRVELHNGRLAEIE